MTELSSTADSYRGMLIGLAIGDALGMSVEFMDSGDFEPLTGMEAGGPFKLAKGYWTDDTTMALCLADSLIEKNGYDSYDVMDKYWAWRSNGYRSSTGRCFDIGNQVSTSLNDYVMSCGAIIPADRERLWEAGNGSIMRLAPIVIASHASGNTLEDTMELARISARETHYSFEAEQGTALFAALLYNTLGTDKKAEVFDYGQYGQSEAFIKIKEAVKDLKGKPPDSLYPGGYIIDSLVVAIWGFMNHDNFKDGALAVVNLGGDSDTTGAIYGQLAGAYYGYSAIPKQWLDDLYKEKEIKKIADNLVGMTTCKVLRTRFEEDGELCKPFVNIYLDIDGVIVSNTEDKAANHAKEFLEYVLSNYPDSTYWLTTHCQGDADRPINNIKHLFGNETIELMKRIKPTVWMETPKKTDAIDFSKPFLWFDDNLFYGDRQVLVDHEVLDNWIEVDLRKDPDALGKFLQDFPVPINAIDG